MNYSNELNQYFKLEYGMTATDFKRIKWNSKPQTKEKIHIIPDRISEINCYFISEYGMNYEDFKKIVPEEKIKSKKRILKRK